MKNTKEFWTRLSLLEKAGVFILFPIAIIGILSIPFSRVYWNSRILIMTILR